MDDFSQSLMHTIVGMNQDNWGWDIPGSQSLLDDPECSHIFRETKPTTIGDGFLTRVFNMLVEDDRRVHELERQVTDVTEVA